MFAILGWPYYRRHLGRCGLITLGVAIAVALYAGMHLGNASLASAFQDTIDRVAGSAELQVTAAGGVREELLGQVRAVGCVAEAAAVIERIVPVRLDAADSLVILAVDLLEDDQFREYEVTGEGGEGFEDALLLLAQPSSVLATEQFAARHGLSAGDAVPVWLGGRETALHVRGLLADTALTRAYGGSVAVMDVYAAQHLEGRRGYFDRIDVQTRPGAAVAECTEELKGQLGGYLTVTATRRGGGSAISFSRVYEAIVDVTVLLAALAALFLVQHSAAIGVVHREAEIAVLLGLGSTEASLRKFILAESALVGGAGAIVGIGLGALVSGPLAGALRDVLQSAFGFAVEPAPVAIDPAWAAATVLATAGIAAAGALGSARYAAAIPPIQLAEARRFSRVGERPRRLIWWSAAGIVGLAIATLQFGPSTYGTLGLAVAAVWAITRAGDTTLFRAVGPVVRWIWPLEGTLAVRTLVRSGRRVRGSLLAISLTVASVIAIAGVTGAYTERFQSWARDAILADYLLHSATSLSQPGAAFSAGLHERIRSIDGVADVVRVRRTTGRAAGRRARLFAVDLAAWTASNGWNLNLTSNSAVVARNFAYRAGLDVGDEFEVPSPSGAVVLRADAIVDDYISELGAIYLDWPLYAAQFGQSQPEMIAILAAEGSDRSALEARIRATIPPGVPTVLATPREISGHISDIVSRWHRANYAQAFGVLLLAVIAVASFLALSIVARRYELGVLEALGATPRQVRNCILAEAVALTLAGAVLGVISGALLQSSMLLVLRESLLGLDLPFEWDWLLVLAVVASSAGGSMLAAQLSIRHLGRGALSAALRAGT